MANNTEVSSKYLLETWEQTMTKFCPGRSSAFELSAELLFSFSCSSKSEPMKVADLACGFGGWSLFLKAEAAKIGKAINFIGLDESDNRLDAFQKVLKDSSRIQPGSLLDTLPRLVQEEATTYDAVLLGWAAHEMPLEDLKCVYAQALKLLKPDGFLFIADFITHRYSAITQLNQHLTQRRKTFLKKTKSPESAQTADSQHHNHSGRPHHHPRHFTIQEHLEALNKAGFALKEEVWRHMNSSLIMAVNPG